jgi:hypothetical protein
MAITTRSSTSVKPRRRELSEETVMKHLHPDWAVIEMKNEKSRKSKAQTDSERLE